MNLKECDFNIERFHYMISLKNIDLRNLTVKINKIINK